MQVSVAPPTENPYPPPQEAWKHGDGPDVPRIATVADDTLDRAERLPGPSSGPLS